MRKISFFAVFSLAALLAVSSPISAIAGSTVNTVVMENCGAYLFEWRPVDCGNGRAFAVLVGGNTIQENNVILNRGYDYGYTAFANQYARPWGQVPDLINVDGVWAVPENESLLSEGTQPVTRIVLLTNNKNMSTNERYIDVVHLPNGVDPSTLPAEVRKYLINVDGSDAGAYTGTNIAGWETLNGHKVYRKNDGSLVMNSWMKLEDETYYFDENGCMLTDTITPDGIYVNTKGEKTSYIPGWTQVEGEWRYVQKNGYYAASTWIQDTDGKWYYFNMACEIVKNRMTPDGFYVDSNGVWDGNPSSQTATAEKQVNPGPGSSTEGWERYGNTWKYKLTDGSYVTNSWKQDADGKWYYFNENSQMMSAATTPDGYYVDSDGVWDGQAPIE